MMLFVATRIGRGSNMELWNGGMLASGSYKICSPGLGENTGHEKRNKIFLLKLTGSRGFLFFLDGLGCPRRVFYLIIK